MYFIAEAGIEHRGNLETAFKMVETAKQCGADCIKFQAYCSDYTSKGNPELLKVLKEGYFNTINFSLIQKRCQDVGIDFLLSVFDEHGIAIADNLSLKTVKIPSIRFTDLEFLEKVCKIFKNVIVSTGLSTKREVDAGIETISRLIGLENAVFLHCVSSYPCPVEDNNLLFLSYLKERCQKIGFSDHSMDLFLIPAAVALGATVIEKHFHLGEAGADRMVALDPDALAEAVQVAYFTELALGDGFKKIEESEKKLLWRR